MIKIKENETYIELELYDDDRKIGNAEVDITNKMISRLNIYEPYRNIGYGSNVVEMLNKTYGCDCLWVEAKNEHAIHVYEKNGYKIVKPTMYLMERNEDQP